MEITKKRKIDSPKGPDEERWVTVAFMGRCTAAALAHIQQQLAEQVALPTSIGGVRLQVVEALEEGEDEEHSDESAAIFRTYTDGDQMMDLTSQ